MLLSRWRYPQGHCVYVSWLECASMRVVNVPIGHLQISTYTPNTVPGIARIGLPPYSYHSEGLHGLRNSMDTLGYNATLFPQTTGMAATGNMTLVKAMAAVMLAEARALNNIAEARGVGPFGRGSGLFYWSPVRFAAFVAGGSGQRFLIYI